MRPPPFDLLFSKWADAPLGGSKPPAPAVAPNPFTNGPPSSSSTAAKPPKVEKLELAPPQNTTTKPLTKTTPTNTALPKSKTDGSWWSTIERLSPVKIPAVAGINTALRKVSDPPVATWLDLPPDSLLYKGLRGAQQAKLDSPENVGMIANILKAITGSGEIGAIAGLAMPYLLNPEAAAELLKVQGPLVEGFKRIGTGLGNQVVGQSKTQTPTAPPPVASPPDTIKPI